MLLWQEYKARYPEGYQYSQFCHLYRQWAGRLDPVMRQVHRGGEKMFVDYAGQTVPIIDPATGEIHQSQIFIAVLGASNYTYAEGTWTQTLPDWIASTAEPMDISRCPRSDCSRQFKKRCKRSCFYEPDINPTYLDMANTMDCRHPGTGRQTQRQSKSGSRRPDRRAMDTGTAS